MREMGKVNVEKRPLSTEPTHLLQANDAEAIWQFATYVKQGKLLIMPTDTVYGIGCDAFNEEAIAELYKVKKRPLSKGIPVLIAEVNQIHEVASYVPESARQLMRRFWPGPLTLVLPKSPKLPANISPDATVAVRIPDHSVTRAIIRMASGAMAVTSANMSGEGVIVDSAEAMRVFDGRVAAVLDDGISPQSMASTVVDCTSENLRVLREGPIAKSDLFPN